MTDKEKLKKIINTLFFGNKAEFARVLDISPQTVTNWMNRGISKDGLTLIQKKINEINPKWLLTGNGNMFNDSLVSDSNYRSELDDNPEISQSYLEDAVPDRFISYLVPMAAMGGSLMGFDQEGVPRNECEKIISPIADIDWVVPVCGDSMEPEYPNGSRVYVRKINPGDFIPWGNVFVIDTTNGLLLKIVTESAKEGCIRCESLNPSQRYKPFDVPMRTIRAMYRVMLCASVK